MPGGRQAIYIDRHTAASIAYDTRYSDGTMGSADGGAGIGFTNAGGVYRG